MRGVVKTIREVIRVLRMLLLVFDERRAAGAAMIIEIHAHSIPRTPPDIPSTTPSEIGMT